MGASSANGIREDELLAHQLCWPPTTDTPVQRSVVMGANAGCAARCCRYVLGMPSARGAPAGLGAARLSEAFGGGARLRWGLLSRKVQCPGLSSRKVGGPPSDYSPPCATLTEAPGGHPRSSADGLGVHAVSLTHWMATRSFLVVLTPILHGWTGSARGQSLAWGTPTEGRPSG